MLEELSDINETEFQAYACGSIYGNYCHDLGWKRVITETYRVVPHYWIWRDENTRRICGIACLAQLASRLFGKKLVGLPYLDYGGIAADKKDVEQNLLAAIRKRALELSCGLELRQQNALSGLENPANEKVSMVLPIAGLDAQRYWKSLDAKVRNQIRKPQKSGVRVIWGREECLDDFYSVFAKNMRDLGSPVHAREWFAAVLRHFPGAAIGTAYLNNCCIAGMLRLLWHDTLVIPWASSLREYRKLSANNALYWESVQFAFSKGCKVVDFGRSSRFEGTYKFKKQWGVQEKALHWYPFDARGNPLNRVEHVSRGFYGLAPALWKHLPLSLANTLGPAIRAGISA